MGKAWAFIVTGADPGVTKIIETVLFLKEHSVYQQRWANSVSNARMLGPEARPPKKARECWEKVLWRESTELICKGGKVENDVPGRVAEQTASPDRKLNN